MWPFIPDNLLSQKVRYTESPNLIYGELSRCSCAVTAQRLDDKISMDLPVFLYDPYAKLSRTVLCKSEHHPLIKRNWTSLANTIRNSSWQGHRFRTALHTGFEVRFQTNASIAINFHFVNKSFFMFETLQIFLLILIFEFITFNKIC